MNSTDMVRKGIIIWHGHGVAWKGEVTREDQPLAVGKRYTRGVADAMMGCC